MLRAHSTFHAITNETEKDSFLFMRLRYPTVELLNSDKAYRASILNPLATIAGCSKPPAERLISLVLSIPNTTARIASDELQLRCTDKSSVQLLIKLPVTSVSPKPLLQALHSGLMVAAAALEAALLETVGADVCTEITSATPESLEVLHSPLIAGGQPVELRSAFRRVAAADTRLHAARAFAVAQTAENVRQEILGKRRERQQLERRARERERQRVREAKKLILAGRRVKRPKPSLFDIEDESPTKEPRSNTNDEPNMNTTIPQEVVAPPISARSALSREESRLNRATGTASRSANHGGNTRVHKSNDEQPTGAVQHESNEPSHRKKKRKFRKLV